MSGVLSTPKRVHHCSPGWERVRMERSPEGACPSNNPLIDAGYTHSLLPLDLPVGTVWECDCGKVWVCEPADGSGFVKRGGQCLVNPTHWRREKRRERRRREGSPGGRA